MANEHTTPHPPETAEFGHVTPGGPTHAYERHDGMEVKKFSVGPFDNNVYVIRCAETNMGLLIDGAADPDRIIAELDGLDVVGIVQTHGHPDHVQALPKLVTSLGVPVYCHGSESKRMGVESRPIGDGQTLQVGAIDVDVWHTPGHTPGSLSFLAKGHLFSGDTLFPAGPGNTFERPAAFQEVMRSLDRLFTLPDDTRVSPGHGLDTTLARERPYVEIWRARGW